MSPKLERWEKLRQVRTFAQLFKYLRDDLEWPIAVDDLEDEPYYDWDPAELGLTPEQAPALDRIRQLQPLTANQPWGIFFLEFSGARLPITPLRRLLQGLVTKKRAKGDGSRKTWGLDDLLFIVTTDSGDAVELHFLAFFEADGPTPEIRSLPWRPTQSPNQHLKRLATELLPRLSWPDDPGDVVSWREAWRRAFPLRHGEAITSTTRLVDRMAGTAIRLREDIAEAIAAERGSGPFTDLLDVVRTQLIGSLDAAKFSDMCAQTLVYGAMTSRVSDPIAFGASPILTSVPLANPFLAAIFEDVHEQASALDLNESGLEQLVADLKASQVEAILDDFGSNAKGGDPVIHFYEEFLAAYDPAERKDAGAFYTPQPAVQFMVRSVDWVLRTRFGLDGGVADAATWHDVAKRNDFSLPPVVDPAAPFVSMIDPATGTGTYLVEWLRQARRSFADAGGGDWVAHAHQVVLPGIHAFELMLAPYAIAHLKTALELHDEGISGENLTILLTDTLHRAGQGQLSFEPDPISVEGERADEIKRSARTTVCIGNPPYDRVAQGTDGGWILESGPNGKSLFDDLLDPAKAHTIFSHHASLYNKFVYFWRWALWKVLEDRPELPGVVSLITPASWLTGPGFLGLRQLIRELADEVWVLDLAGDGRGARQDENIFDIQTPVAIVTLVRRGSAARKSEALVRYRQVLGTRADKLALLSANDGVLEGDDWITVPGGWHASFVPPTGAAGWSEHPLLTDLFPWQQPGCKFGRTWPISPDAGILKKRWKRLVSTTDASDRATCFVTPPSGRNITTSVSGLRRIVDEPKGARSRPVVRYAYRSFDRQWAFDDPRLTALERPSLWAARSDSQVFMVSKPTHTLGGGPAATATTLVPDLHCFRGSFGGKDVFPMYRDSSGTPNVDPSLLSAVNDAHRRLDENRTATTVERLFAYSYGVLAGADYTERFAAELETPGPRVPLSADPALFDSMAQHGERLLWLHTYGERFVARHGSVRDSRVRLKREISRLPDGRSDIRHDTASETLVVADGTIAGVPHEVWNFEVSGMPVVRKWLGYRTLEGAGRARSSSSPLDHIRPMKWAPEWTEELLDLLSVLRQTIDLLPGGTTLLDQICAGDLIAASALPPVPPDLRNPPKVTPAARSPRLT